MTIASAGTAIDRAIIAATQEGLSLTARPFEVIARQTGIPVDMVMQRMSEMQDTGIIRRIAAVPNHFALGWEANGMTVWDVDDTEVAKLGPQVGALDFVTHCYRRPRVEAVWPYNLFAMVHGQSRDEVAAKTVKIAKLMGAAVRAHEIIYSARILKKTGFRLKD